MNYYNKSKKLNLSLIDDILNILIYRVIINIYYGYYLKFSNYKDNLEVYIEYNKESFWKY